MFKQCTGRQNRETKSKKQGCHTENKTADLNANNYVKCKWCEATIQIKKDRLAKSINQSTDKKFTSNVTILVG